MHYFSLKLQFDVHIDWITSQFDGIQCEFRTYNELMGQINCHLNPMGLSEHTFSYEPNLLKSIVYESLGMEFGNQKV